MKKTGRPSLLPRPLARPSFWPRCAELALHPACLPVCLVNCRKIRSKHKHEKACLCGVQINAGVFSMRLKRSHHGGFVLARHRNEVDDHDAPRAQTAQGGTVLAAWRGCPRRLDPKDFLIGAIKAMETPRKNHHVDKKHFRQKHVHLCQNHKKLAF